MPAVSELLTTIKDLSLVGSGDSTDDARILRYLNMVYREIYRKTAKNYPTLLLTTDTVAITAGAGTLPEAPMRLDRVKDTSTNRILAATSLMALEAMFPALSDTDAPAYYYMQGETGLKTYPVSDASVLVRYIPRPAQLTAVSAETDIKMPPMFHDALVWGTLVYCAMDERDKLVGAELNTAQSKYEIAMADYEEWLFFQQTQEPQGTEAVLGG